MQQEQKQDLRHRLAATVLLVLFALVAIVMASFAWFSISDQAKARQLALNANAGNALRFDLDAHDSFDQYVTTLGFDQISARISSEQGVNIDTSKLQPVTTFDGQNFTYEDGSVVQAQTGAYLEFTLHFISHENVIVRLTGESGSNGEAGTAFSSNVSGLPQAMRMSFTCDGQTWVYNPNLGASSTSSGSVTTFGIVSGSSNQEANMFSLIVDTDKPTVVRIWLEGTDQNCTNMIKGADYSVTMRFEGIEQPEQQ